MPNEQSLTNALGQIKSVTVNLNNAKNVLERETILYKKGISSKVKLEQSELNYNRIKQELNNAKNNYQIIKRGSIGGGNANTNIRATTYGTVLQIFVKEGNQVIQSNNFNAGTSIALVADMSKMVFKGKVDESEVARLKIGMPLKITIGAIEKQVFKAKLNFIAPKGIDNHGTVEFTIKGDLDITNIEESIRAGYSVNASVIIAKKNKSTLLEKLYYSMKKKH